MLIVFGGGGGGGKRFKTSVEWNAVGIFVSRTHEGVTSVRFPLLEREGNEFAANSGKSPDNYRRGVWGPAPKIYPLT